MCDAIRWFKCKLKPPKKGSQDRRVILDLSFPIGNSVNDGIPKDSYMGFDAKLTFPRTDDFAVRLFQLGQGYYMFKIDLSGYFRQIPLDPRDYSLIGYVIDGNIYFDKVLLMGMRSAPYIAQRITNAITYIHRSLSYFLLNYVDDFFGAEVKTKVWQAYTALTQLLENLRVETSKKKIVPPTTRLEFLGITFDTNNMTMEILGDKLKEIKQELNTWLLRTAATRREIESLVGKVQFLAKCIKSGRVFIGRLIQWLRTMNRRFRYAIPLEARKDIAWWARFAQQYNGVSLLWLVKEPTVLNTGSSRDTELQNSLREIALIAAENQFVVKARHISGISNRIPDWLLRWDEPGARREFRKYAKDSSLKHIRIKVDLLHYKHKW